MFGTGSPLTAIHPYGQQQAVKGYRSRQVAGVRGCRFDGPNSAADGGAVQKTLQELITARMRERGWSYADLARRSGDALTKGRWQQLGSGSRMSHFPEPDTVMLLVSALEFDVNTVVLACAASLRLPVSLRGPDLAQLLPAGTDRLTERMRDAILAIIRAAVAETLAETGELDGRIVPAQTRRSPRDGGVLEWSKSARNTTRRAGEDHA